LLVVRQFEGAYLLTSETYPLFPLTTLGRAPTNTITIQDTFASNEHALIALRNSQWWLEDRKSRNGTLLNGMAVIQPIIVTDGDVISIGNMSFKLQIER
jgi:pSer/pThr/pTyr-binding forkhead associated (FHA) protein